MTQEFVTLPREIVEQAIYALYCTNSQEGSPAYNFELKAIKELRAALEQQQGEREPVAGVVIRDGLPCLLQDRHIKSTDHRVYTHPQPKREPLTDEQIVAATRAKPGTPTWLVAVAFTRAIEAAHNIK